MKAFLIYGNPDAVAFLLLFWTKIFILLVKRYFLKIIIGLIYIM